MSNYHWLTGEEMIPPSERKGCNPNPVTLPPPPPGFVIKSNQEPINWPFHQKCQDMNNAELESLIREARQVLINRQNARANELIDKVCVALNELKELGIQFIVEDMDGYDFYVMDTVEHFDKQMFKLPEVKL